MYSVCMHSYLPTCLPLFLPIYIHTEHRRGCLAICPAICPRAALPVATSLLDPRRECTVCMKACMHVFVCANICVYASMRVRASTSTHPHPQTYLHQHPRPHSRTHKHDHTLITYTHTPGMGFLPLAGLSPMGAAGSSDGMMMSPRDVVASARAATMDSSPIGMHSPHTRIHACMRAYIHTYIRTYLHTSM